MTIALPAERPRSEETFAGLIASPWAQTLVAFLAAVFAGLAIASVLPATANWPDGLVVGVKTAISEYFRYLDKEAMFGLSLVKDTAEGIAWIIKAPLNILLFALGRPVDATVPSIAFWVVALTGLILAHTRGALAISRTAVGLMCAVAVIDILPRAPFLVDALNPVTVKSVTRTLAWLLKQPLLWSEILLFKGAKAFQFVPIAWLLIATAVGVVVARFRDGRTGFFVAISLLALVALDGLPYILESAAKALRADPPLEPASFIGLAEAPGHVIQSLLDDLGARKVKAIPWLAVVGGFTILAHWIGGWRLAATVFFCLGYLVFTGLWRESMKTFSLVLVAVPFAAALGLWLGVLVTRSRLVARTVTPLFDLMQAIPHLAYLVPVVVMFGAGQVPALLATVIFAMPPMARCTILAINTVPSEVAEAGRMSGCTPRQLLWKVQLPASQRTLLLGLNQVIMQTLAMVVIASLVGAAGLGHKLLFSLQQLKLGFATMQGVAIVLMAVALDRMTQAYANRSTDYAHHDDKGFVREHAHLLAFGGLFLVSIVLATFRIEPLYEWFKFDSARNLASLRRDYLLIDRNDALEFDKVIKTFTYSLIDYIRPVRDVITVNVLIPLREFYQSIPWVAAVAGVGALGWRLGGWSLAALTGGLLFFAIVMIGNWEFALTTFYYVSSALVLCAAIGITVGITATQDMPLLTPRVTTGDIIGALLI
ncbi:MAG: ABC transporter permease subunit, partial [Pseudomonadota bacterium]